MTDSTTAASPRALDPYVIAATTIYTMPGVVAVLLGSGVSRSAGIPTGWGVVQDLVRRAAIARQPDSPDVATLAFDDPETWWAEHGDGRPLGYSSLLEQLGPTRASRQALLASYFEPSSDECEEGLKAPTAAHRAIAELVRNGYVRVVLTTNFDRLMERALDDVGITPQVVTNSGDVDGMTPLVHARATVIKLHGDYTELGMKNTTEELSAYAPEMSRIASRVFDEYGVLVSGWSADWDVALASLFKQTQSRRYPLYWDSRSSRGVTAKEILARRGGVVIPAESADDLFHEISHRVSALERLASPPITSAVAVERLKRYVVNPIHRIDLEDLVESFVDNAIGSVSRLPTYVHDLDVARVDAEMETTVNLISPLLQLLARGVLHDIDRNFMSTWVRSVNRLLSLRNIEHGAYSAVLANLRHYPALLALRTVGLSAIFSSQDDVLVEVALSCRWHDPYVGKRRPALEVLYEHEVLDYDTVQQLPRWNGVRYFYPFSKLLRENLWPVMEPIVRDPTEYARISDSYEYRMGLLTDSKADGSVGYRPVPGLYLGDVRRSPAADELSEFELDFRAAAQRSDSRWPWWDALGISNIDGLDGKIKDFRVFMEAARRYR